MEPKIKIESFEVEDEIKTLLLKEADKLGENEQVYMLSFHDDGVVWGKWKDGEFLTSDKDLSKTPSPEFRRETLQELRLFGQKGQLHIWRTWENEFQASLALNANEGEYEFLQSEEQVLNGNYYDGGNFDFTIVRDGEEGLRHAFPKAINDDKFKVRDEEGNIIKDKNNKETRKRPLRLHVKHYIEYDKDGCARIAFSRLASVSVK